MTDRIFLMIVPFQEKEKKGFNMKNDNLVKRRAFQEH